MAKKKAIEEFFGTSTNNEPLPAGENSGPQGVDENIEEQEEILENLGDNVMNEFRKDIKEEGEVETNAPKVENITEEERVNVREKVGEMLEEKVKMYKVFITGKLLLVICDSIFPKIIAAGYKKFDKSWAKNWKELMLTEDQIEEMEPIADEIVEYIFANMHPVAQFGLSLGACYMRNI